MKIGNLTENLKNIEIEDLLPGIAGLLSVIDSVLFYQLPQAPVLCPQMTGAILLVLCLGLYFPGFDLTSYQTFRVTSLFFDIFIVKTKIARFPAFGTLLVRRFDFRVESLKTKHFCRMVFSHYVSQ